MKELTQKKDQSILSSQASRLYRPKYQMAVRKTLNPLGWLFALGLYTAGVVLITARYTGNFSEKVAQKQTETRSLASAQAVEPTTEIQEHASEKLALTYNLKNLKILGKMHEIEIKRFKRASEKRREKLALALDLTSPNGQEQWREFSDREELKLAAIKARHQQEKLGFSKEGYIVVEY